MDAHGLEDQTTFSFSQFYKPAEKKCFFTKAASEQCSFTFCRTRITVIYSTDLIQLDISFMCKYNWDMARYHIEKKQRFLRNKKLSALQTSRLLRKVRGACGLLVPALSSQAALSLERVLDQRQRPRCPSSPFPVTFTDCLKVSNCGPRRDIGANLSFYTWGNWALERRNKLLEAIWIISNRSTNISWI